LEHVHQAHFLDFKTKKKRPVVKEAIMARCELGGSVVEFGSHPCIVGVGWNIAEQDVPSPVMVCLGRAGQYAPDSFESCELGISLVSFPDAHEQSKSLRRGTRR